MEKGWQVKSDSDGVTTNHDSIIIYQSQHIQSHEFRNSSALESDTAKRSHSRQYQGGGMDAIPIPESMTDQINLKSDLTSRKAVMRQQTITQSIHQSHADRSNTRRVGKMPTEEEVETGGAREAFRPLGTKEMNLR